MNFSGIMGSFFRISEVFMKFLKLNLIWLLFNLPIIYLGLDMLFRNSFEEVFALFITIIILMPFLFFPATSTLFAIVRKWIMKKPIRNMFLDYWKYYKQNYVRSLLSSIIFMFLGFIWVMNFRLSNVVIKSPLFYLYLIIALIIIAFICHFYSDTVHFDVGFFASLQKSLYMTIFHIPYTLGAASATIIALLLLYLIHPIVLLIFSASITAYIYFFAYYQIYLKAVAKQQAEEEKQENITTKVR